MPLLSTLFGQPSPVATVRRALAGGSLPGAYLFVGAPGVGKGALAAAVAQAAACLEPTADPVDSCGVCDSCRRAAAGNHPEIITFLPAGEQTQIWQFWERDNKTQSGVLARTLNYAPVIGGKRVYIIEHAETLSEAAANSLLKVLEEPPHYVLFILAAPHPARVLPTIMSRCQMVRVNPAPRHELQAYLESAHKVEPLRAATYAALSEGKIGQACRLAQTPRVGDEIGKVMEFAQSIPQAPPLRALKLAEQMRKLASQIKSLAGQEAGADQAADSADDADSVAAPKDRSTRRQLGAVFDLLVVFYRDLMALSIDGGSSGRIMNCDRAQSLTALAAISSADRWMRCLDALMIARRRLDANASVPLVTDVLMLTLVQ